MRPARALAGTAVALVLGGSCLVGCSGDDTSGSADTTTTVAADATTTTVALVGTLTATEAIIAGQCLDDVPDPAQRQYGVLVIPCEDPHTYEVYAQAKLENGESYPPGAPYPGALKVANDAENQCFGAFDQFMGVKWEESDYDIQTWWPSQASWDTKKDRTILCAVYRVTGGRTKGSVRGTGQ